MEIASSSSAVLNTVFIIMIVGFGVYGYFRGMFKQGIDLIATLVIAWLASILGTLFAKDVNLVGNLQISEVSIISNIVVTLVNQIVWFIVLFVMFSILVGIVRIIALKHIKTPWSKRVDRIGGLALSVSIPLIAAVMIVSILSLPIFTNGKEIISSSVLSPLSPIGDSISTSITASVDPDGLLQKITSGEELNEENTESLTEVLTRMGIPEEIAVILAKAYTGAEVTQEDLSKVKAWIMSQGYTEEDIRNMMREIGLSEEEIDEILNEYGN